MKDLARRASILTVGVVGLVSTTELALAGAPDVVDGSDGGAFLCPAVGGPNAGGTLPGGQNTFLPRHNQAGAHANVNGHNTLGPGESPGPGDGNSDWSPIWPAAD